MTSANRVFFLDPSAVFIAALNEDIMRHRFVGMQACTCGNTADKLAFGRKRRRRRRAKLPDGPLPPGGASVRLRPSLSVLLIARPEQLSSVLFGGQFDTVVPLLKDASVLQRVKPHVAGIMERWRRIDTPPVVRAARQQDRTHAPVCG